MVLYLLWRDLVHSSSWDEMWVVASHSHIPKLKTFLSPCQRNTVRFAKHSVQRTNKLLRRFVMQKRLISVSLAAQHGQASADIKLKSQSYTLYEVQLSSPQKRALCRRFALGFGLGKAGHSNLASLAAAQQPNCQIPSPGSGRIRRDPIA